MFGIQLDIPVSELDTYPSHDHKECFTRVFASWERKGSPNLSWGTVINILKLPIVGERRLAEEIKEKMAPSTSLPLVRRVVTQPCIRVDNEAVVYSQYLL